jgi:hypothetical protein
MITPDKPPMTRRRTRFVCWITKATDTHSELSNAYCFYTATMTANASQCSVYTYIAFLISLNTNRLGSTADADWFSVSYELKFMHIIHMKFHRSRMCVISGTIKFWYTQ